MLNACLGFMEPMSGQKRSPVFNPEPASYQCDVTDEESGEASVKILLFVKEAGFGILCNTRMFVCLLGS